MHELGHYDDYHDRHPRNGSAPCLDDALQRAPFTTSTSRERSTARLGPNPAGARTLRRLPRPGGTELRHVPPHCSRDLGHGHGAGSGHLPRLQPPTCSRSVNGVGLGLFICGFFTLFTAVSRAQLSCCSSLCDVRLLSVNVAFHSCTGPVWGRGSGPSSCRPRARVACVVWAWDLFVTWRLCRGIPAPVGLQFFALRFVTVCHQPDISPLFYAQTCKRVDTC
jgi:hypothetical protein